MKKLTINHEEFMVEQFKKDPEFAAAYLSGYLEDNEENSEEFFLEGLRYVAKAYGFSKIAKKAKLGRESLYKALSKTGNPKITTLSAVLKAMGFRISIQVIPMKKKAS